ncbi:MAG TPA: ATP-binding cassette domain-containing protein [Candidatus Bathyarchaeia archaeon]|nr:ATP-binding cassette domain-containing protein [Candidatus Bathyarchaeia archaeon]
MSVIKMQKIDFSFYDKRRERETQILKQIDLEVKQGECHLITGPSGSGKTTLLQIIGTILQQKKGQREILAKEIPSEPSSELLAEIRKQIGYLFQSPYLPPHLTVSKYIELQSTLSGVDLDTADERATDLMQKFDIESFKNNRPTKLSGGEKQRVALAGVMAKEIKLLLLDEPTGSLDYDNKVIIWDLLKQLKEEKLTIVVVSHDESITTYVDKQHKLDNGKLGK